MWDNYYKSKIRLNLWWLKYLYLICSAKRNNIFIAFLWITNLIFSLKIIYSSFLSGASNNIRIHPLIDSSGYYVTGCDGSSRANIWKYKYIIHKIIYLSKIYVHLNYFVIMKNIILKIILIIDFDILVKNE